MCLSRAVSDVGGKFNSFGKTSNGEEWDIRRVCVREYVNSHQEHANNSPPSALPNVGQRVV